MNVVPNGRQLIWYLVLARFLSVHVSFTEKTIPEWSQDELGKNVFQINHLWGFISFKTCLRRRLPSQKLEGSRFLSWVYVVHPTTQKFSGDHSNINSLLFISLLSSSFLPFTLSALSEFFFTFEPSGVQKLVTCTGHLLCLIYH